MRAPSEIIFQIKDQSSRISFRLTKLQSVKANDARRGGMLQKQCVTAMRHALVGTVATYLGGKNILNTANRPPSPFLALVQNY